MSILSLEFFALVLVCRIAVPRLAVHWQHVLLLFASVFFCFRHSPESAAILLWIFLVTDFTFRGFRRSGKKWMPMAGIAVIVITWILSRLFNPASASTHLTGVATGFALGLTFYMLQAVSFLRGLGDRKTESDPTRVQLLLYLAYFPKLSAGPIEPPGQFIKQLRQRLAPTAQHTIEGFMLVLFGMLRKSVLGDPLIRSVPDAFYADPGSLSASRLVAWLAALLFGIYNDFLGYTQIARGVSRMLGIQLSRNFRFPFFSRSVSDAWTRWHITLSQWLREFIFFPISRAMARRFPGTRHLLPMLIPPMAVMIFSGLWHGFKPQFPVWGILIGLMVFAERVIHVIRPPRPAAEVPIPLKWAKGLALWCFLGFSLVPFSMPPQAGMRYFAALFRSGLQPWPVTPVLLMIPVSLLLDRMQQRFGETLEQLPVPTWNHVLLQAFLILIVSIFLLTTHPVPFIYQGF